MAAAGVGIMSKQQETTNSGAAARTTRQLAELGPGLSEVALDVMVLDTRVADSDTMLVLAGDESGMAVISIAQPDVARVLRKGDLLRIANCDVRLYKWYMMIYTSSPLCRFERYGTLTKLYDPSVNRSRFLWSEAPRGGGGAARGPRGMGGGAALMCASEESQWNRQRWWEY